MSERLVRTVEVPLSDSSDETIRVQIREVDEALVRVGRGGRSMARAERSFGQMLDTVRPVAESFVERFRELAHAPDEITLEFGVSLSVEAELVVASTATEANFSVSLTWNKSDMKNSPSDNSRQG
ncbi:CU044_2847 family protein [Nocardiopsis lambiniae]|uniref:CU044_2847 family protein n=1 Tax=Nocardiopsis lambiniae TaxID=3075539 RepID=A0ABU2M4R8_9ACTN|nr:CU044_2847 family protein [Nocardiopsis sp. DSM 44743]MDT0327006.1 CU044_2847 family protein [Nocardiopsis sp. DSM 44743]